MLYTTQVVWGNTTNTIAEVRKHKQVMHQMEVSTTLETSVVQCHM